MASLAPAVKAHLLHHWPFWARPNQLAPAKTPDDKDWRTWLVLAGRGFGKTRMGAEWVRSMVCGATPHSAGRYSRVALVAETAADARDVMVEGQSGLLSVHPKEYRPIYEPSKRRVTWPNGASATLFNATEPDQLRGPQHDLAWLDELAKWRYAEQTYDMLQFGLRLGNDPRQMITTTPRPIPLIKRLLKDASCVVTRGSTYDNESNLAKSFVTQIIKRYEGTRLGRQELNAEVLDDAPGALWSRGAIDDKRISSGAKLPDMRRVVVAIDPAAVASTDESGTAETGIVVAGLGVDGRGYVIDDLSCRKSPNGWARMAVSAYDLHKADAIVAETNQGGDMVEQTIRSVRPDVSYIGVRASRGKVTRAEPVAALYEQGRISHVGSLPQLEDQMVLFTAYGIEGDTTADRVDALVWAFTELFPSIIAKEEPAWSDGPAQSAGWLGA
jgi:predicted phage terminase large subunit-like protein